MVVPLLLISWLWPLPTSTENTRLTPEGLQALVLGSMATKVTTP